MNIPEMRDLLRRTREHTIYVVEFTSGIVKVGQTTRGKQRIWTHGNAARDRCDEIVQTWMSDGHLNAIDNERALIDFCAQRWARPFGREFFDAADFDLVVEYAETLPFQGLSAAEVAEYERECDRQFAEFVATNRPARRDSGPPVTVTIRLRPERLPKLRALAGFESDVAFANAMGLEASVIAGALAGHAAMSARFIAGIVDTFGSDLFPDLFEVVHDSESEAA